MSVVKNLLIRGGADFSNIYKQTGKLQSNLSGFQSGLKNLGIAATITAIGVAAVSAIKTSTKNAMDAIEDQSLINTVFGENSAAMKEWANTLQSDLGISGRLLQKNAATIYNISKSMGMGGGAALDMSKGVATLAEDMASFYNLDSDEAFTKLRSGLTGETEPLKQLGIMVDQNTLKMYGFSENISNAEKVAIRYKAILAQTATAQGDLARTINSPANQLRILKTNLHELSISFGNIFIPILQAILPVINSFVLILTQACNKLSEFMYLLMGMKKTDSGMGAVTSTVGELGDNLDSATSSAKALKGQLAGFDEINKLGDSSSGSGGGDGDGYSGSNYTITSSSGLLNQGTEKIADDKFKGVRDILISILETLATIKLAGGIWKMLGLGSLGGAGSSAFGWLGSITAGLSAFFGSAGGMNLSAMIGDMVLNPLDKYLKDHLPKKLYDGLTGGLIGFVSGGLTASWVGLIVGAAGGPIGMLAGAVIGTFIGGLIGAFKDEIGEAFKAVMDTCFNWDATSWWFEEAEKNFKKGGVNILLGIIEGFEGAISFFVEPIADFFNWLTGEICGIFGIHSPATTMMPLGANILYGLLEGFRNAIQNSSFYQQGSSIISSIRSGLSSGWSSLSSWWSSLRLSSFGIKMPHLSWSSGGASASGWIKDVLSALSLPTSLPKLNVNWYANGGYVGANNPMLAVVGDNKQEGEIITPESKIYEQVSRALKENGGNGQIVVNVNLDGKRIERHIKNIGKNREFATNGGF